MAFGRGIHARSLRQSEIKRHLALFLFEHDLSENSLFRIMLHARCCSIVGSAASPRQTIVLPSAAVRPAPPAVLLAAAAGPTTHSPKTPSTGFVRGPGRRPLAVRPAATCVRHSRPDGGRWPAPRRGLLGRSRPSCAPPFPAPACCRTPRATTAPAGWR